MLTGTEVHFRVKENGLPADSKIVGSGYNSELAIFYLQIESESFEPVPIGHPFPVHDVVLENINPIPCSAVESVST